MISKLEKLCNYYFTRRQVGHTTAMLNGAKSNPNIIVVVAKESMKRWIDLPKNQMITIKDLEKLPVDDNPIIDINDFRELQGLKNPIIVDHYALQVMTQELVSKLKEKDKKIEKLEKKIIKLQGGFYKQEYNPPSTAHNGMIL